MMNEYEAKMTVNNQQFQVDFIGGPFDGLFGTTKWKVNEVETHGERHPNCLGWVKHIYQRSNPDTNKFFYRETINDFQSCLDCERIREREAKWEAEKAEREAFQEFQKTIKVVIECNDETRGYDWETAQIGKSSDGRLWIRYGSGCSCNSIDEEDWSALTDRAQALSSTRHFASPIERANFIAKAQELLGENK